MEQILIDTKPYHKSCFKCAHCAKTLNPGTYASLDGKTYCKPHFKQLFKLKGNYNEGFGSAQHKHKWDRTSNENLASSSGLTPSSSRGSLNNGSKSGSNSQIPGTNLTAEIAADSIPTDEVNRLGSTSVACNENAAVDSSSGSPSVSETIAPTEVKASSLSENDQEVDGKDSHRKTDVTGSNETDTTNDSKPTSISANYNQVPVSGKILDADTDYNDRVPAVPEMPPAPAVGGYDAHTHETTL